MWSCYIAPSTMLESLAYGVNRRRTQLHSKWLTMRNAGKDYHKSRCNPIQEMMPSLTQHAALCKSQHDWLIKAKRWAAWCAIDLDWLMYYVIMQLTLWLASNGRKWGVCKSPSGDEGGLPLTVLIGTRNQFVTFNLRCNFLPLEGPSVIWAH